MAMGIGKSISSSRNDDDCTITGTTTISCSDDTSPLTLTIAILVKAGFSAGAPPRDLRQSLAVIVRIVHAGRRSDQVRTSFSARNAVLTVMISLQVSAVIVAQYEL